jgi:hypothetical protein
MIRRILTAVGAAAVFSAAPVAAAEINSQGAEVLKQNLSGFLPDQARDSGFLKVVPAGNRYEVIYDFAKLLATIDSKDFKVSGLKPFSVFAIPVANGMWKLNSDSNTNFTVSGNMADGKSTTLDYSITDMVFSGIFDPAISYLRSGEATSGPIRVVSRSGPDEEFEASFAGMNYSLGSTDSAKQGSLDFTGKGSFSRFYERISVPETPPMQIRAESLDFDVGVEGVTAAKLRDLVNFVLTLADGDEPSEAQLTELKRQIRGAMPFFTALSEKITFNKFAVASPMGDFGLGKLDYSLTMTEPSEATRIGVGARVENISTPAGLIPDVYAPLVPDMAEMEVGIADLNVTRFVDTLMEMDVSKPGPLPDGEGERLGQAFLQDGQLTVDFPKIVAKSALYEIEASGEIKGYPDEKERYTLQSSVVARDIDKLIQYFQGAAKTDPQFSQVSFLLMMAKGMGKTEADGRLRWDIRFENGQTLTVNDQVIQ